MLIQKNLKRVKSDRIGRKNLNPKSKGLLVISQYLFRTTDKPMDTFLGNS
jgi:hypothetical protein